MDGSDLTQRQRAILDFIVESVERRGYPPAVREIGQAVGLASPSTVHAHLQTLEDRGYLRRDPTKPRAIEVRWGEHAHVERPAAQSLPIYGSIAAGPTSLAEQVQEGTLAVPEDFIDDTPHFVLRVKGESMIGAGINDGDFAVVRVNASPSNGEIVAAQVEGPTGESEATIKRFRRDGNRILLMPENPAMEPIVAPPDVRVLGKVVAILRRL
ncbi:MAG: regulatory protein LexA [Actinobacteria bacterium]|jgi:repressor LexA|nr:regulatory protein LexA [Actinomycetota bacterium]MCW3043120.1 regulatory protein LexA [Actinomycetota bacterium]MEA2566218.1 repressor LexA [Actinomycetota bacterium]